jgi:hypothetical protein
MMFTDRFDQDVQGVLSHDSTVAPQRSNELFRGLGRIQDSLQKSIPVRSDEDHPFMLFQNTAGSLIGEITRRESRDSHRTLNELLGRRGDA